MDPLVIKVPEEILGPQESLGKTVRPDTLDSQGLKVTPVLAAPQAPLDSQDQKDLLVEWVCQELLEKKACPASPGHRASLAHLERKGPKERRGSRVCLASEFLGCLARRATKGSRGSQEAPERRARRAAQASQECRGPQALRGLQGLSAIQEALECLGRKETKASPDWMAFLVSKEKQVSPGSRDPQAQLARKESLEVTGSRDRREKRVNQVFPGEACPASQGPKETKVPRAKWASLDWPEAQEFLEAKASQDSWVLRDPKDSQACPAFPATPWKAPKETEARRDSPACQGIRDPWGPQVSPGWMD